MGKKVVVAMNAPGPMITSPWDDTVSALVVSWLPGQQNGRGIAMALYNESYGASGRLPFTFPKCSTQSCSPSDERLSVALGDKISSKSYRNFTDKALIGYRWYHARGKEVSFPFGFGLVGYGKVQVQYSSATVMATATGFTISCQLKHSSSWVGHDVPQLYLSFPFWIPGDASIRPEWVLKGFTKVAVVPGSSVTVSFPLVQRDVSYWDDAPGRSTWVCVRGIFRVCIGANARDAIRQGKGSCTTFTPPCNHAGSHGVATPPEGPPPLDFVDCGSGYAEQWSEENRYFCCKHMGRGCNALSAKVLSRLQPSTTPKPTTTTPLLEHQGEDCWSACGWKSGYCGWCGQNGGACCRQGVDSNVPGCHGVTTFRFPGHYECVLAAEVTSTEAPPAAPPVPAPPVPAPQVPAPSPTPPPKPKGPPLPPNPFEKQRFYINPVNAKEFDRSISTATGHVKANLQKMQQVPSAYWIDVKAKIRGDDPNDPRTLEGILKDAASKSPPELVVVIWYDLPNRDCDALASNGEICCTKKPDGRCNYLEPGDCADGIKEYKTQYADPFIAELKKYEHKVPIVVVVEPDSIPNIATNTANPQCGNVATKTAYREGIRYALGQLAKEVPSVTVYLDAAHGGWLGWESNLEKYLKAIHEARLPMDKVRGFATNVANYQPLGIQCPWCPDQGYRNGYCLNSKHADDPCCYDPCKLLGQGNPGNNELNFASDLVAGARALLGFEARVIIDTGRNGVSDMRSDCRNWCNPRGAGAGIPATIDVANRSLVDAYFWLKTPGESDGCSQAPTSSWGQKGTKCVRFDRSCISVDSLGSKTREDQAPEAGHWFDYEVKDLAANMHFAPLNASRSNVCPVSTPLRVAPPAAGGGAGASGSASGKKCAAAFKQCAGITWTGTTCCQSGCGCQRINDYYGHCMPETGWECHSLDHALHDDDKESVIMKKHSIRHAPLNEAAGSAGLVGRIVNQALLPLGLLALALCGAVATCRRPQQRPLSVSPGVDDRSRARYSFLSAISAEPSSRPLEMEAA